MIVVLVLSCYSFGQRATGDEWAIFDETAREGQPVVAAKQKSPIISEIAWEIDGTWQKQWANEKTLLKSVSVEDSQFFTLILNGAGHIQSGNKWRFSYDGGLKITTKGKHEFRHKHPAVAQDDLRYIAFLQPSLHELTLRYTVNDSFILEGGLLPQKNLVNSLFLNTGNYLDRFVDDALDIGAYTFCGVKAFFPSERHSFAVTYLPALPEGNDYLADIFHFGKTSNLLIFQNSYYIGKGRVSFLGFLEEKEEWTWAAPYLGLGFETQYPFATFVLHVQALVSEGKAGYALQQLDPASEERYLLPDQDSLDDFFPEALLTVTCPLTEAIEVTLGYNYTARGLSAREQDMLFATLARTTNPNVLPAASGLGSSALPYTQHLGLLNLSYPNLTENMGVNALLWLNLLDGSGKMITACFLDLTDTMQLTLTGTLNFGSPDSLFGSEFNRATFQFGLNVFF